MRGWHRIGKPEELLQAACAQVGAKGNDDNDDDDDDDELRNDLKQLKRDSDLHGSALNTLAYRYSWAGGSLQMSVVPFYQ